MKTMKNNQHQKRAFIPAIKKVRSTIQGSMTCAHIINTRTHAHTIPAHYSYTFFILPAQPPACPS